MDPWRLRIRRDGVGSEVRRRAASFVASMDAAMVAIGDADLSRVHAGTNNSLESVVASIESAPDYDWFWWDGRCELVYHLLVRSRPDLVLAGNAGGRWDLSATFATNFGSQAVGNFWSFLVSYMLRVYVGVNAVLAAKSLEGGGKFKQVVLPKLHQPESYVLSMVREDCDGRTFLHTERAALAEGTLFKDEEATRNMLKAVFRFMAGLYAVQRKHWGDARAREWWFSGEFGRLGYALVHLGTALSDS
ncbi:hypothetical protein DFJ73DRAFT_834182 [Zopfochytrium polystomum]|nr:hypothetical protein DFJ73DRAFT_834182 [Zopfochytrium polystomum]